MFDPERMHVRDDAGRLLSPAEIVAGWRQVGTVEQLAPDVDPEPLVRESWRPAQVSRGGNAGFGAQR